MTWLSIIKQAPSVSDILESAANFFVELSGNGFDPQGCQLPAFQKVKPPSIKPPEKKKKVAIESDEDLYSDEEIGEMSDAEFAIKVGGARTKSDFIRQSKEAPKKQKAIVFDDLDSEDYGITPREYGEMLAYNPPLRDLALAKKVKAGKEKGESLADLAKRINEGLSLVKHYSAALSRARDDGAS